MNEKNIRRIIISRTDAIGDVVLTLPLATLIKKISGDEVEIIFFGRTYTFPVISCSGAVDKFIDFDSFEKLSDEGRKIFLKELNADAIIHVFPRRSIAKAAKNAGIPIRIGTTNRLYHWLTCNRLVRLSRKNSSLHEAQLNVRLLKPLGYSGEITLHEIGNSYRLDKIKELPENIFSLLSPDKFKLIIHPKSHSSAREWAIENYTDLIRLLPEEKFQIIITGGKNEKEFIDEWLKQLPSNVLNLAGKISLDELISLLNQCNGIIAASTGPLHIAAALGKFTLGIYPPIRPMNPTRWAPLGSNAGYLVSQKDCSECRKDPGSCHCINEITPQMALQFIMNRIK